MRRHRTARTEDGMYDVLSHAPLEALEHHDGRGDGRDHVAEVKLRHLLARDAARVGDRGADGGDAARRDWRLWRGGVRVLEARVAQPFCRQPRLSRPLGSSRSMPVIAASTSVVSLGSATFSIRATLARLMRGESVWRLASSGAKNEAT